MELDQLTILIIVIQIYIPDYLLSDAMELYTWFRTNLLGRIAILISLVDSGGFFGNRLAISGGLLNFLHLVVHFQ